MTDDPVRLREGGSAFLKKALESARRDVPDDDRASRLEARILPLLVPPPPPTPPTPPPPDPGTAGGGAGLAKGGAVAAAGLKGLSLVKAAVVGIAVAALVGGASVAYLDRAPNALPAPPSSGVLGTSTPEPSAAPGLVPLVPSAPVSAPTLEKPKGPAAPTEPKDDDPAAEMALLHSAQDSLRTSPSSALAKTAEHARRYPRSALAQEREVIAVEALVNLGRKEEARLRVARFEKSYPGSTHARRLEALVE